MAIGLIQKNLKINNDKQNIGSTIIFGVRRHTPKIHTITISIIRFINGSTDIPNRIKNPHLNLKQKQKTSKKKI